MTDDEPVPPRKKHRRKRRRKKAVAVVTLIPKDQAVSILRKRLAALSTRAPHA